MEVVEHKKEEKGYHLVIQTDDDEYREFTWGLEPPKGVTVKEYKKQQVREAEALIKAGA